MLLWAFWAQNVVVPLRTHAAYTNDETAGDVADGNRAPIEIGFVETQPDDTGTTYQIFSAEAADPERAETIADIAAAMIRTAQQTEVVALTAGDRELSETEDLVAMARRLADEAPNGTAYVRELPSEVTNTWKARFRSWYAKNYRRTLTWVRGSVNGIATGVNVAVSNGVPVQYGLPAGLAVAAMSGSIQWNNKKFNAFIGDSTTAKRWLKTESIDAFLDRAVDATPRISAKFRAFLKRSLNVTAVVEKVVPYTKWGFIEWAFMSVITLLSLASLKYATLPGDSMTDKFQTMQLLGDQIGSVWSWIGDQALDVFRNYGDQFSSILKTVGVSMAAGAPWSVAIAETMKRELAKDPNNPVHHADVEMRTNTKNAVLSMIGVAISVAMLMGQDWAMGGLIGLAGAGIAHYIKVHYTGKGRVIASLAIGGAAGLALWHQLIPYPAAGVVGFFGVSFYGYAREWYKSARAKYLATRATKVKTGATTCESSLTGLSGPTSDESDEAA